LNGTGAERAHVAQRLGEFDRGAGADPLEGDQAVAAIVDLDAGA
jgi:hypothetical protein